MLLRCLLLLTACCLAAGADKGPDSPRALYELARKRFAAKQWGEFFSLWSPASRKAMEADRKIWETQFAKQPEATRRAQLRALGVGSFLDAKKLSVEEWSGRLLQANERINGGPFGETAGYISTKSVEGRTLLSIRYLAKSWPHKRTHKLAAVKLGQRWYFRSVSAGPDLTVDTVRRMLLALYVGLFPEKLKKDAKVAAQLQKMLDQMYSPTLRESFANDLRRSAAEREKLLAKTNLSIEKQVEAARERALDLPVAVVKLLDQKKNPKGWSLFKALVLRRLIGQVLEPKEK